MGRRKGNGKLSESEWEVKEQWERGSAEGGEADGEGGREEGGWKGVSRRLTNTGCVDTGGHLPTPLSPQFWTI